MGYVSQNIECGCDSLAQDLMPVDSAVSLALSEVVPVAETELLPLHQCLGRTAAKSVLAQEAMPFFDNSAMDGFAVNVADVQVGADVAVSMTIAAGDAPTELPAGTAARIYTGAPIPLGADAVVMSERCTARGDFVSFQATPKRGENIRYRGSDQNKGAVLLAQGERIASRHVGLLAANGVDQCLVYRPVRVGVFSTGDELAASARGPGQIHDANRPMLMALCEQLGAQVEDLGVLPDDFAKTAAAFAALKDRFDLVLTSGAVSIGGRDHVRGALISAGGTLDGWRVAIKPGKPVAFGRLGKTIVTGLPGNPFASFVGFQLFVAPQLEKLSGQAPRPFAAQQGTASFEWTRKSGRAEVFPVRLSGCNSRGGPMLSRLGNSVSATLYPLAGADGLAMVCADTDQVSPGDCLRWHPFCSTGELQ